MFEVAVVLRELIRMEKRSVASRTAQRQRLMPSWGGLA
jgi:hypothetical protein